MNFIVHYRTVFEGKSFDGITTVRNAANATDAGITVVNMVRATAPSSRVEITGTKETSDEDFERFMQIVKL
jgi:hypothetical protein